jgi:hypothetical protein
MYSYCMFMYRHRARWHTSSTLSEGFPCIFLSCRAHARVKPAKMGHGPHSSKFLCCSMYSLFCVVLYIVFVSMCTVLLPPGGYPIAVNKYIISYHIGKDCFSCGPSWFFSVFQRKYGGSSSTVMSCCLYSTHIPLYH